MRPKRRVKKAVSTAPKTPVEINQLEVLEDRSKLREYCVQNSIKTPDFFVSNEFSQISQWAMKKNIFPLCLKTSKNYSNNHLIFVLRAYREMPEFFDKIQEKEKDSKVIIEEFLEGKAYLEVTILEKKVRLISQISLNKTMKIQKKWVAFPIKLPESIFSKISEVINKFDKLIESVSEPIRFSFAIKNAEPILLAINCDNNRLEYSDDWREQTGLKPLSLSEYSNKTDKISKINIYKLHKDTDYDFSKAVNVCDKTKVKQEIKENKLYFMITSESAQNIAEDFEKANAIIKQIIETK